MPTQSGKKWTIEENIGGILLLILTLVILLQIAGRLTGLAPIWTEEIGRFLFIWCIFLGISAGVTRDSHVGTEILASFLPARGRFVLTLIANSLFIVFCLLVFWKSMGLLKMQYVMGQRSPAMNLPMYVVGAVVPFGFALTTIRLAVRTWGLLTRGDISEDQQQGAR